MSKVSDSIQRGLEEAVAYAKGKADKSLFRIHTNSGNPEREDTQSLRETRNTRRRLAKTILRAFLPAGLMLTAPEIAVGDDQARVRIGQGHGRLGLGEFGVQIGVFGGHFRLADGVEVFV